MFVEKKQREGRTEGGEERKKERRAGGREAKETPQLVLDNNELRFGTWVQIPPLALSVTQRPVAQPGPEPSSLSLLGGSTPHL